MPASLPGSTLAENQANPSLGQAVTFSPFSGPLGSPFDYDVALDPTDWPPSYAEMTTKPEDASGNCSTGGLSTGIGFSPATEVPKPGTVGVAGIPTLYTAANPNSVGYPIDSTIPGVTLPDGIAAVDARLLAIGGGRSEITPGTGTDWSNGTSAPDPYDEVPILAAGNGGVRDGNDGEEPPAPDGTGFGMKVVTASGAVANGAAIESGFTNRSGAAMVSGLNQFGVSVAQSAPIT